MQTAKTQFVNRSLMTRYSLFSVTLIHQLNSPGVQTFSSIKRKAEGRSVRELGRSYYVWRNTICQVRWMALEGMTDT